MRTTTQLAHNAHLSSKRTWWWPQPLTLKRIIQWPSLVAPHSRTPWWKAPIHLLKASSTWVRWTKVLQTVVRMIRRTMMTINQIAHLIVRAQTSTSRSRETWPKLRTTIEERGMVKKEKGRINFHDSNKESILSWGFLLVLLQQILNGLCYLQRYWYWKNEFLFLSQQSMQSNCYAAWESCK